jgi:glycosyltransferase involved in cell wall biosynthesis
MNCYNGASFLREAVDSVLAQTYTQWEIIFWDNQSTDASASIVASYQDPRIRYFRSPEHTTLSEARNLAAQKSGGEWLAFLDCDDWWHPEKLQWQMELVADPQHSQVGLIYSRGWLVGGIHDGKVFPLNFEGIPLPEGKILGDYLTKENFILLVSAVVKKAAFLELGGIPGHLKQAEDYYLFAGVASKHSVRAVQKPCCFYRIHQNNLTWTQRRLSFDEIFEVIDAFWPSVADKPHFEVRLFEHRQRLSISRAFSLILDEGRLTEGAKALLRLPLLSVIRFATIIGVNRIRNVILAHRRDSEQRAINL